MMMMTMMILQTTSRTITVKKMKTRKTLQQMTSTVTRESKWRKLN